MGKKQGKKSFGGKAKLLKKQRQLQSRKRRAEVAHLEALVTTPATPRPRKRRRITGREHKFDPELADSDAGSSDGDGMVLRHAWEEEVDGVIAQHEGESLESDSSSSEQETTEHDEVCEERSTDVTTGEACNSHKEEELVKVAAYPS